MNEILATITFFMGTIIIYVGANYFYKQKPFPFTMPMVTATFTIIVILLLSRISYQDYMLGGQWIDELLGPAVVALAYPLYNYRASIRRYSFPLLLSILTGVFVGIITGISLARLIGVSNTVLLSILTKSVTTPVATEITKVAGGTPSIAVIFVMIAGVGGVILAPSVFQWIHLNSDIGRGIALGSACHAIGTAKSLEYGDQAAAISSVTMTLSALFAAILIPYVTYLL